MASATTATTCAGSSRIGVTSANTAIFLKVMLSDRELLPPPPELAPSCAEGRVLGVLPGIVGSLQANETLKLALGIGESLAGRLLLFDAPVTEVNEVSLRRDPDCPVCGEQPTITEYVDYAEFCAGRPADASRAALA